MRFLQHLHDHFFPHPRNNYRPHFFSAMSIALLVLVVIVFEGAYLVQTKYVFLKTDFLASVLPSMLVALTNEDRAVHGLAGVAEDAVLNKAAQLAAEDMAKRGYFSHVSPDGKLPWQWLDQVGYTYSYAGQNLAVNFTDSIQVELAWMESSSHRANIVKREYTHMGLGTARGVYEGQETTFVVEFFAAPAESAASIALAAPEITEATATSATTIVQVLGTQVANTDTAGAAAAPAEPNWFARLLASPLHTLLAIFTAFFAIIAIALALAVLVRSKIHHPHVLIGGTLLLALIGTSMLLSTELASSLKLAPGTQVAAVGTALSN